MTGFIGWEVQVPTSQYFHDRIGKITSYSRKSITVDFDGQVGIYTIEKNQFIFPKNNALLFEKFIYNSSIRLEKDEVDETANVPE